MKEYLHNWQKRSFAEACHIFAGYGFPERLQGKPQGDLPFFKVGDISEAWKRGQVHLAKANHYISYDEAIEIRAKPLPAKTTVFAKIGAAIALNRRAILSEPSLVDNNVMGVCPATDTLDHKFLYHFVCTLKLDELSRATTVPSIRKTDIEQITIPLPPLDKQRGIVAEIEKQFTRLEAGMAALKRVQANLKRYRAAVLKAACEGRLVPTEADFAHKEGRAYETGDQLLARILTERRRKWQGRGKYKEPAAPDTANLPPLPQGWTWASVAQVGDVQLGRQRSPKNVSKDYPTQYIRAANITEHGIDLSDLLEMEFTPVERERFNLQDGDIVLSEASGSASQVGKPAVWKNEVPLCCFQNTVLRLRPVNMNPRYILVVFQNFYVGSLFAQVAGGVGINHLGAAKFSALPFPIPPLAEQERIVAEVERRLSVIEEQEAVVAASLQRAARLRQSILERAFSGRLHS